MFIAAFFVPQIIHVRTSHWVSGGAPARSDRVKRLSTCATFRKKLQCTTGNLHTPENPDYEKLAELFGPPLPNKNDESGRLQQAKEGKNDTEMQNGKNISNQEPVIESTSRTVQDKLSKTEEYRKFEEYLDNVNRKRAKTKRKKIASNQTPERLPEKQKRTVIPEEKIEDDNEDAAKNRAQMYEEMEELLGPPEGRFQRENVLLSDGKGGNSRSGAPEERTKQSQPKENDETPNTTNSTESAEQAKSGKQKFAVTFEEEYELLEANLRANKTSNKPRKGRKPYPSVYAELDGIMLEPWRTDYNLMPKKGLRESKPVPTKKSSKRPVPEVVQISAESIIQSYRVLEKILHDEEREWNEEQEKLQRAEEEKREAKEARRLARREARIAEQAIEISASSPQVSSDTPLLSKQKIPASKEESKGARSTAKINANASKPQASVASANLKANKTSNKPEPAGALKVKHPPHLMLSELQGKLGVFDLKIIETKPPNFLEGVSGLGFPEFNNEHAVLTDEPKRKSDPKREPAPPSTTRSDSRGNVSNSSVMRLENPKLLRCDL